MGLYGKMGGGWGKECFLNWRWGFFRRLVFAGVKEKFEVEDADVRL